MSALVVEDDERLRELLDIVVRRCGLTCHSVGTGDVALSAIRTEKYGVIILDLMLPGMSGFEILRSLQATHPHLLRRIIILTAASQATLDREFDSQSLVWSVIRKPFEIDALMDAIDECARFHTTVWPGRKELSSWLAERSEGGGARAAVIAAILSADELHVLASHGFRKRLLNKSFPLPLSAGYPICVAARTGKPVWLASISDDNQYPLCSVWTKSGSRAIATIPMRRHGSVAGAIGWSFGEPQRLDHKQRAMLLECANDCVAMIPTQNLTDRLVDIRQ